MAEFQSETKRIRQNAESVYLMLSDLNNLERIKSRIPQDKVKNLEFDADTLRATVDPIGTISFRVVDRTPHTTIKYKTENSPFELFLWIQLKQLEEKETAVRVTIQADLNPFVLGMVSKPLQEGVDKIADLLTKINFE